MTNDFFSRLDAVINEYAVLDHPFYRAWNRGALTREHLQDYAKQYYQFERNFPRFVSAVHANTEKPEHRQQLLENLLEEERGTDNHPELWLRFADALGCQRDDVLAAIAYEETAALGATLGEITRNGSTLEGVAALYGYESQIPEVSKTKIDGLKKYYGVTTDDGLAFFRVHEEADEIHRRAERDMLAELITSPQDEAKALAAARAVAKAYYDLLTGVVRENKIECDV